MTRTEAIKHITKLYGARAYWRVGTRCSSPEDRETAMARLRELRQAREDSKTAMAEWLARQPEYQAMKARHHEISQQIEQQQGECSYYKFSIGRNIGYAVVITGWGDTWEDAIGKARLSKD